MTRKKCGGGLSNDEFKNPKKVQHVCKPAHMLHQ